MRSASDAGAHDQASIANLWKINLVRAIIEEPGQLDVADHADDLESPVPAELQLFSDGILVGKQLPGEGLAAHQDGRCIGEVVGSRERPPSQQGYPHGTQVVPRHAFIFDTVALFRLVLAAHNPDCVFVHINPPYRSVPRIAGSVHSGNG